MAEATFGRVDISLQSAGIVTITRIEAMADDEQDRGMAVNTKGVFPCCREAVVREHPDGPGW